MPQISDSAKVLVVSNFPGSEPSESKPLTRGGGDWLWTCREDRSKLREARIS